MRVYDQKGFAMITLLVALGAVLFLAVLMLSIALVFIQTQLNDLTKRTAEIETTLHNHLENQDWEDARYKQLENRVRVMEQHIKQLLKEQPDLAETRAELTRQLFRVTSMLREFTHPIETNDVVRDEGGVEWELRRKDETSGW